MPSATFLLAGIPLPPSFPPRPTDSHTRADQPDLGRDAIPTPRWPLSGPEHQSFGHQRLTIDALSRTSLPMLPTFACRAAQAMVWLLQPRCLGPHPPHHQIRAHSNPHGRHAHFHGTAVVSAVLLIVPSPRSPSPVPVPPSRQPYSCTHPLSSRTLHTTRSEPTATPTADMHISMALQ